MRCRERTIGFNRQYSSTLVSNYRWFKENCFPDFHDRVNTYVPGQKPMNHIRDVGTREAKGQASALRALFGGLQCKWQLVHHPFARSSAVSVALTAIIRKLDSTHHLYSKQVGGKQATRYSPSDVAVIRVLHPTLSRSCQTTTPITTLIDWTQSPTPTELYIYIYINLRHEKTN